jgi:hypothetical protein
MESRTETGVIMLQPDQVQRLHEILASANASSSLKSTASLKVIIRHPDTILKEIAEHVVFSTTISSNSSYYISKTKAIQNVLDNFTDSISELDNVDDAFTLAQVMIDEAKRNDDNLAGTVVAIACLLGYQFRIGQVAYLEQYHI